MTAAEIGTLRRILNRASVDEESGCWVSGHHVRRDGYAHLYHTRRGETVLAHRVSFAVARGFTLEELTGTGLVLDHVRERGCVSRACVNPNHLELVTQRVNAHRGEGLAWQREAAKTRCPRGHALLGANLSPGHLRRGARSCLTCQRASTRIRHARDRRGQTITYADVIPALFEKYPGMARDACLLDAKEPPCLAS